MPGLACSTAFRTSFGFRQSDLYTPVAVKDVVLHRRRDRFLFCCTKVYSSAGRRCLSLFFGADRTTADTGRSIFVYPAAQSRVMRLYLTQTRVLRRTFLNGDLGASLPSLPLPLPFFAPLSLCFRFPRVRASITSTSIGVAPVAASRDSSMYKASGPLSHTCPRRPALLVEVPCNRLVSRGRTD